MTYDHSIAQALSGTLKNALKVPKKRFCHYTSLSNALVMLKDYAKGDKLDTKNNHLTFFASQAQFLNDSQEFLEGKEFCVNFLSSPVFRKAFSGSHFAKEKKEIRKRVIADSVFVCCFCGKPNLRSQWAGYGQAGGDSGVSIEFDFSQGLLDFEYEHRPLRTGENGITGGTISTMPFPVCYEKESREKFILKVAEHIAHGEDGLFEAIADIDKTEALLDICIPFMKNKGFIEEDESRCVFFPPDGVVISHRISRGMIVPSVKFSVSYCSGGEYDPIPVKPLTSEKPPIKRIVIGPSLTQHQIFGALFDMLEPNNVFPNTRISGVGLIDQLASSKTFPKKKASAVDPGVIFCDGEDGGLISVKTNNNIIVALSDLPLRNS